MLFNKIQKIQKENTVEEVVANSNFVLPEAFKFSKRYVWIGETGIDNPETGRKMDPVHIKKWNMFKGVMMGMFSASVGSYKYLEDGLHLFVSLEDVVGSGYEETVGYVSSTYSGVYAKVLGNCIPEVGWREIGYAENTWLPGKTHIPSAFDPANDGDNAANKSTNVFWKHVGLDVARRSLELQRPLKMEYFTNDEWKQKKVDWFESLYNMSVEERRDAIAENAIRAQVNKSARKQIRKVAAGFTNTVNVETVRLQNGEQVAAIDLIGHELVLWSGKHKVPGDPQPVDAENLTDVVSIINDCNLTIEIAS